MSIIVNHVLVIEDEPLVALDLEDRARECGAEDVTMVSSVAGALKVLAEKAVDFAIVDGKLRDGDCKPVILALTQRENPLGIYSGSDQSTFSKRLHLDDVPFVPKPAADGAFREAFQKHARQTNSTQQASFACSDHADFHYGVAALSAGQMVEPKALLEWSVQQQWSLKQLVTFLTINIGSILWHSPLFCPPPAPLLSTASERRTCY